MHTVSITLDRTQRDALHAACLLDLTGVDEVELYVREGDFEEASALIARITGTAALLDDLGWDPETSRERFPLHGDAERLRAVVARLRHQAEDSLRDQAAWITADAGAGTDSSGEHGGGCWIEEVQRSVDEDLDTRLVCDRVLELLDHGARAITCRLTN